MAMRERPVNQAFLRGCYAAVETSHFAKHQIGRLSVSRPHRNARERQQTKTDRATHRLCVNSFCHCSDVISGYDFAIIGHSGRKISAGVRAISI